jgi:hypothetical protein
MKRTLAVLALMTLAAPAARAGDYLQSEPQEFALGGAQRLSLEFPVGELQLEGDDGSTVRVLVRIDCKSLDRDDCEREARRIRVDHEVTGRTFRLEFTGIRKNAPGQHVTAEARILVPRALAAQAHMGVGKATITGLTRDVDVELGVGELFVRGAESDFRDAEAEAGVGDVSLQTRSGHVADRGFIGHRANWSEGRGESSVHARVGVGHASVSLR